MNYHSFSLIPAFSDNILSDRLTQMDKLFSRLTGEKPLADTPQYNLLKKDKDNYELTVSVPGYDKEDLDISVLSNQLIIHGKQKEDCNHKYTEEKEDTWLHRGIIKNHFSLSFKLNHKINIKKANLEKGLLTLIFIYDRPEEEKPKKIYISSQEKISSVL